MLTRPRVRGGQRPNVSNIVAAGAVVAILAVLAVRPGDSGGPTTEASGSPAAEATASVYPSSPPDLDPAALPDDATALIEDSIVAAIDPRPDGGNAWLVGPLAGPWTRLSIGAHDAEVRTDWGKVVVTTSNGTGLTIAQVDVASGVVEDLFRTADVFAASGAALSPDEATLVIFGIDIGVMVVDVATGDSKVVVPGLAANTRHPVERGDIVWAPDGSVVASPLCDSLTCRVDVVDLRTSATRTFDGFVALAVSERFLVGYESEDDRAWRALDLATGDVAPIRSAIGSPYDAIGLGEATFLIYGGASAADGSLLFSIVDLTSGTERIVHSDSTGESRLYEAWRSPSWALIGGRDGFTGAIRRGESWSLLDLRDGRLLANTVEIAPLPTP